MINLDELERLEKEATPGPWNAELMRHQFRNGFTYYETSDADLIAAMRNALPALIRELRAARECVAEFRQSWELDPDEKHALILYDEACK